MVILDTCAIIELFQSEPALTPRTYKQIIESAYILSASFAEIACKVKLGKLEMNLSPSDIYKQITEVSALEIIDIGVEDWFESIELDWKNKDPVDRLIVAFASKTKRPIVTCDKRIKEFYKKTLW